MSRIDRVIARNVIRNTSKLPLAEAWALRQISNPRAHVALVAVDRFEELRHERLVREKDAAHRARVVLA